MTREPGVLHPGRSTARSAFGRALTGAVGLGAGVLAYSLAEAAWFHRVRRSDVMLGGADGDEGAAGGDSALTVLHISDLHLLARNRARLRFISSLRARVDPDLVILTGDTIASPDALDAALTALDGLLYVPGAFVFGSNDYVAPLLRNPLAYLWRTSSEGGATPPPAQRPLPAGDLAAALTARGWLDLRNRRARLSVRGVDLSFVGVDDPHVGLDEFPDGDGVRGSVHLGVAHAPYTRVLDAFRADGCALALFGHTHGGQVCVPGYGALVTNCDLPTWRASGTQGWPGARPDGLAVEPRRPFAPVPSDLPGGERSMWVSISAGLGTSPFTPVRLACPPEVSVLRMRVPRL